MSKYQQISKQDQRIFQKRIFSVILITARIFLDLDLYIEICISRSRGLKSRSLKIRINNTSKDFKKYLYGGENKNILEFFFLNINLSSPYNFYFSKAFLSNFFCPYEVDLVFVYLLFCGGLFYITWWLLVIL